MEFGVCVCVRAWALDRFFSPRLEGADLSSINTYGRREVRGESGLWVGWEVESLASVRSVYTYTSIGISSSSKWAVCMCVCVEWQQLPTQRKEEENGGGEKGRRRQKVVRNSAGFNKKKKKKKRRKNISKMFFWLKFLNRTESSSFDYLFQTGERSLRVGLMTLTSRFTRHKRMNEKKTWNSLLCLFFFLGSQSPEREQPAWACVCPQRNTRSTWPICAPVCVVIPLFESRELHWEKKIKRKKKLTEKNRIGFRRIERKGRPCMEKVSLSLWTFLGSLFLSLSTVAFNI